MTCFFWMLLFHDVKLAACRCIKACSELNRTIAVLRLECSIDCIGGQWVTNKIFPVHFLTVSVSFEEILSKKCN